MSKITILTCYYNPMGYKNRLENYKRFKEELGQNLLTVECAFGDDPFTLKDSFKVRANSVLWQKERLLRIGETLLPKEQDVVIWLDCDILFENKNWVQETIEKLKTFKFVQPFAQVHRRFKDWTIESSWSSFGQRYRQGVTSNKFNEHGHTGFAFATRRADFDLYDKAIAGTADHLMLHAMVGQMPHKCIDICCHGMMRKHFYQWAWRYYESIMGSLSYVDGDINHLYHGSIKDRKYLQRAQELSALEFNPYTDLYTNDEGLLELKRSDIQGWVSKYFAGRNEDE